MTRPAARRCIALELTPPQGAAYREAFAAIDRREKLIDRDDKGHEFPSKEDRSYWRGKAVQAGSGRWIGCARGRPPKNGGTDHPNG
jgi:hypothetical protein